MIQQVFSIGDRDWHIEIYYNVWPQDMPRVYDALVTAGCPATDAESACDDLSVPNSGYTFTHFARHKTVMVISHATDAEQMYDTIQHETRHAADNIGEYYGLPPRGEESAYLQGEISRKMFVAAAMSVCPKCNHQKYYRYGL